MRQSGRNLKHIVIIYQYFGTPAGGWSTRVYENAKVWVQKGIKVTVITSPYYKSDIKPNGYISRQIIDGINLIVINSGDSNKINLVRRIIRAISFAFIASFYTILIKSDTVIASSGPITVGIPGLAAKLLARKKLIFEVRDLWPSGAIELGLIRSKFLQWIGLKFEKICYLSSDLVVPCSVGMDADIIRRYPQVVTLTIPNACDPELFNASVPSEHLPDWAKDPANKVFIYFGSLGFMDACDEIIRGYYLVEKRKNIHIVFLGDGADRESLIVLSESLGVKSNVHFQGLLPKNKLSSWLKISVASFVVFRNKPVLSTSSPNKMFDSFAAGLPVIQNTGGWIKELVEKNCCGLTVEPENPESMASAISRFALMDSEELDLMKQTALSLAMNDFNRKNLADLYLESIAKLAAC